jgi:hypothetical protein
LVSLTSFLFGLFFSILELIKTSLTYKGAAVYC